MGHGETPRSTGTGAAARDGARSARLQLFAATAAIVLSQTGVVVGLLVAVQPELRDLRDISRDHALVVKSMAEIRGEVPALLRAASGVAGGATAAEVDRAAAHLRAAIDVISPLADTDRERTLLARLSRSVEGLAASARGLVRLGERVGGERERLLSEGWTQAIAADEASQDLVAFNADQVRSASDAIRGALLRITAWSAVAAALGTLASIVLLRMGWAGLTRHEVEREAHRTELEAFAGRVAHELRTPLHTIDLSLAVLRGSAARPDVAERARAQVRALDRTLRGLLDFSRAGGRPRAGERGRVEEAIDWSIRDLGPALAEPGAQLERVVEPHLEVAMDPAYLRTVIVNLVQNSLKYGRGADGASVRLTAAQAGSRVRFEVRDHGPGMAPEVAAHAFEPFFRGAADPEGYGLGLATVKRLVEAHGGALRVESASGRGTVVHFELPSPPPAAGPGARAG